MGNKLAIVILAAGKGTRMKSHKAKVLHPICGRAMVRYIIDKAQQLNPDYLGVVIGYQAEAVRNELKTQEISFIKQREQLGTGHALLQAYQELESFHGMLLVLCGDTPLLSVATLKRLVAEQEQKKPYGIVLTTRMEDPAGYGRVVRTAAGSGIEAIVEEKDLACDQAAIKEVNTGTYIFRCPDVFSLLRRLDRDNAQGEYYLTDVVSMWATVGRTILGLAADSEEALGINDRCDLARAEQSIREVILRKHMLAGVTIENPATTFIGPNVTLARDVVIRPGCILEGDTKVETNCTVGPYTTLADTEVGEHSEVVMSCVRGARIGRACRIGPFAHIRPGTVLAEGVKAGDFVEIKQSHIGSNSKIPHLSYIGDTVMGPGCNVGAGTITANYDGKGKHPTTLGQGVFIGSNSTLVAPVNIGDGGRTGAGAVVTKDVPPGVTVVGVPARPLSSKKKEDE